MEVWEGPVSGGVPSADDSGVGSEVVSSASAGGELVGLVETSGDTTVRPVVPSVAASAGMGGGSVGSCTLVAGESEGGSVVGPATIDVPAAGNAGGSRVVSTASASGLLLDASGLSGATAVGAFVHFVSGSVGSGGGPAKGAAETGGEIVVSSLTGIV